MNSHLFAKPPAQPRVLTVSNRKGGVGKSTLCKTLAIYFAREDLGNKRVLLIDMDSQSSLSKLLLDMEGRGETSHPPLHPEYDPEAADEWSGRSDAADIFQRHEVVPYPVTKPYPIPNLDLLPADTERMLKIEHYGPVELRDRVHNRLLAFVTQPELAERYDLVLIDTGPKESPTMRASVRAATHLLVPLVMEAQCINGVAEMMALWRNEAVTRPPERPLQMVGFVVNRFDVRYRSHTMYLEMLQVNETINLMTLATIVPQRAAIAERDMPDARPAAIFDLPRSQDIRDISLRLCAEVGSKLWPEEAERFAGLEPDPRYAALVAAPPRESSL